MLGLPLLALLVKGMAFGLDRGKLGQQLFGLFSSLHGGLVALSVPLVLLLIEMTADKIPAIDSLNDIIQTAGRPLAGAILFAAGSGLVGELHPVLAFIAGLLIAGGVHAAKTAARPVITLVTGGMGNWLVSLLEDVLSFIIVVVAILLPLLVLLVIAALVLLFVWVAGNRTPTG